MTCRHGAGDTSCSSHPDNVRARQYEADKKRRRKEERDALTPDADKYEIRELKRVGRLLVLKVWYPNCTLCAHEGVKIMVMPWMSEMQMLQLKRIDPHFRPPYEHEKHEAPSPIARFPGSEQGWKHAIAFAASLENK
jgi:hypothetical protein